MELVTNAQGERYYVLSLEDSHRVGRDLKAMMLAGGLSDREHGYVQSFRQSAMDKGHHFSPAGVQMINRLLVRQGHAALR